MKRRNTIRHTRPGVSLVYTSAIMVVLIGFLSLAVDMGRVQLARMELRTAADGGAFAGATVLRTDHDEAISRALDVLGSNSCNGEPIEVVGDEDVQLGRYRYYQSQFIPAVDSSSRVNALRVTARRDSARGNPIPLTFARVLGFSSWDVGAPATVMNIGGRATLGIVGIDSLTMIGTSETDSYTSSEGPYNPSTRYENGDIASNGLIDLRGTVDINGSAHTGPDGDMDAGSNTNITGDENPFSQPLNYPPVDASSYYSNNDNLLLRLPPPTKEKDQYLNLTTHDLTFGAGVKFKIPGVGDAGVDPSKTVVRYHIHNLTVHGTAVIEVGRNVEMYVTGAINIAGNIGPTATSTHPSDFKILVDGPGAVQITGQGNKSNRIDCVLYAPEAAITIGGNTDLMGAVIGKTLDVQGTAGIHYDEALGYEQTWPEETILVE